MIVAQRVSTISDRRRHPRARRRRRHRPRHARRADRATARRTPRSCSRRSARRARPHDAHRRRRERRRDDELDLAAPEIAPRPAAGTRPAFPASGRRTSRTRCAAWAACSGRCGSCSASSCVVAVTERHAQRVRPARARPRHRHHRPRRDPAPGHRLRRAAPRAVPGDRALRRVVGCCRSWRRTCSPASSSG